VSLLSLLLAKREPPPNAVDLSTSCAPFAHSPPAARVSTGHCPVSPDPKLVSSGAALEELHCIFLPFFSNCPKRLSLSLKRLPNVRPEGACNAHRNLRNNGARLLKSLIISVCLLLLLLLLLFFLAAFLAALTSKRQSQTSSETVSDSLRQAQTDSDSLTVHCCMISSAASQSAWWQFYVVLLSSCFISIYLEVSLSLSPSLWPNSSSSRRFAYTSKPLQE